jgi:ABC-type nitrate/sulfonate/bicarbonate transport system ATPase subunit
MRHIRKAFRVSGEVVTALEDVSLTARPGEFITLIGPSGCGKSTLLNIACGLMEQDEGEIALRGATGQPRLGHIAYMPQRDLLLPWRTVMGNLLLGPQVQRRNLAAARREAEELLPLFGLDGFAQSYPATLSGGMRQRAALMRTFLCRQEIIALDEPFGALDALTRRTMRAWLLEVWTRFGQTVLFVTHDVEEAVYLSDRVYVFSPRPGRIVQEVTIDLPRPREEHFSRDPRSAAYRDSLLSALGL